MARKRPKLRCVSYEEWERCMRVAKVIRGWRERHSVRREQLAVWTDRSLSSVKRWESGAAEPRLGDLRIMNRHHPGIIQEVMEAML